MSRKQHDVFICDRCGGVEKPREDRQSEDDDGFPARWAHVTFRDSQVNWKKDLCGDCGDEVGKVIRIRS